MDAVQLQREIDDFMADYDDQQKINTHTTITEPDEEGWCTGKFYSIICNVVSYFK